MKRMHECPEKEMRITLDREGHTLRLNVFFSGDVSRERRENISGCLEAWPEGQNIPGNEDGLLVLCLALLREHGARCRVGSESGQTRVEILLPVHSGEKESDRRESRQRDLNAR